MCNRKATLKLRDLFEDLICKDQIDEVPNVYLEIEKKLWASGFSLIAGVDEVGRGPLAGPVVASACILPKNVSFPEIRDSKTLTEEERKKVYDELTNNSQVFWSVSCIDHELIDQINILRATLLAMKEAVERLSCLPDFILIDGRDAPPLHMPHQAIIKGDLQSQSIAAASILAKVTRDAMMDEYHEKFPQYGFSEHKGYGTKSHLAALEKYGASPIHRKSFGPVKRLTKKEELSLFL